MYGRVLLSKTEGVSRFFYPSLSRFVKDSMADDINTLFLDFIWKNKTHKQKAVLFNNREGGGLEALHFIDTLNAFKINWLKRFLANPNSTVYGSSSLTIFLIKWLVFLLF